MSPAYSYVFIVDWNPDRYSGVPNMRFDDHTPSTDPPKLPKIPHWPGKQPAQEALHADPCVALFQHLRPCYRPWGLARSLLFHFPHGFSSSPISSPDTVSVLSHMALEDPSALTLASASSGDWGWPVGISCGALKDPRDELEVRAFLGPFLSSWQPGFEALLTGVVARCCVPSWRPRTSGDRGQVWEGVTFDPCCVRVCTVLEKQDGEREQIEDGQIETVGDGEELTENKGQETESDRTERRPSDGYWAEEPRGNQSGGRVDLGLKETQQRRPEWRPGGSGPEGDPAEETRVEAEARRTEEREEVAEEVRMKF
ncbi:unnamed protein product [Coregonus sp. 'balchen']|nr:unnamed protein product [Coregonus sp. 'balchen']